jgi:hypothetical protein
VLNEFEKLGMRHADSVKICGVWFGASAHDKNEKRILECVREKSQILWTEESKYLYTHHDNKHGSLG